MKELLFRVAQITRDQVNIPKTDLTQSSVAGALQLVFGVAGGIAVLIVTIAGFKYVVSAGNPESAAKAKNAIIYALVGLLVCLAAYSVVTIVLDELR